MEQKTKKYYGLGIVVSDKPEDVNEIDVYPVESMPNVDGDLSVSDNGSLSVKDNAGNNIAVKYNKSNKIPCTWYPNGEQNRVTAPDVCKGDLVEIYTFGDTDKYYWCVHALTQSLRKREKVLYYFSNKGGIGDDSTKAYFLLIDTRNKKVHFHTDNTDGEACAYDVLLDTAAGSLVVSDSLNNSIALSSTEGKLTITTNEKIILNTKEATVNCLKSTINAKDTCDINTSRMTIRSDICNIN